jgi:hypothetical protein
MRYLVHFFDANEHLRRSEAIDCPDDEQAITAGARLSHPHVVEVWSGDRRVWRFETQTALAKAG